MTEDSNSTRVRMNDIDPAKVAAQITGCRESSGMWSGYCDAHQFFGIGFVQGRWPCSVHIDAAETIRAVLEQVWDEGEAAGLRRADYVYGAATMQAVRTNPYKAIRGESE